ncbi:MAG TPA: mycofactocin-coupled SDR family oxidoreductase [Solirubrobacterales bacterium]|jgi:SDR family mycofactocin-dependent oxidoreductase|nr:mycofactocin-coupled SDR family oxidoreductase [Solirubrobacterales bacterium]
MSGVAIVTGAARGIGAATALALAAEGRRVVAVDRGADDPRLPYAMGSAAELDAVAAAANEAAGEERVRAELADATDAAAMAAIVARAEEWGGVEVIVANAGVIAGGLPAWELSPAEEDAVVEVCLRGVMVAARVGIPALLRRPEPRAGRFVATASAASFRGLPGLAAYCAAKAGVSGFVRALAADLRGTGITAAAVAPGSTDTPILAESARLYALDAPIDFAPQQPIERLIDPAEVAATIAFLCGPGGAVITGSTVSVDGGLSI